MRKYELIVIFNPTLNESAVKDEIKKLEKIVEPFKVQNLKFDNWGRKQIAYQVEKQGFGTFVCMSFETENFEAANTLTAQCRLMDTIIKYQAHRLNDRPRKFKGNPKRKPSVMQAGDDEFGDSVSGDF